MNRSNHSGKYMTMKKEEDWVAGLRAIVTDFQKNTCQKESNNGMCKKNPITEKSLEKKLNGNG